MEVKYVFLSLSSLNENFHSYSYTYREKEGSWHSKQLPLQRADPCRGSGDAETGTFFPAQRNYTCLFLYREKQVEEEKQRRKEEKKSAKEGVLVEKADSDGTSSPPPGNSSSSTAQMKDEAPLLLNPDLPDLKAVLEKADVILHVLDARDPASYRIPHVEDLTSAKEKTKLVFVLNKIGALFLCNVQKSPSHISSIRPRPARSVDCMGETPT